MQYIYVLVAEEKQNGNVPASEQHELLMKDGDRESGATHGCRSDSDNRSHVSALSSHPSHSSHSNSHSNSQTQSQNLSQQSSRSVGKSSLDRMYFPRHELQTIGILGKIYLQYITVIFLYHLIMKIQLFAILLMLMGIIKVPV